MVAASAFLSPIACGEYWGSRLRRRFSSALEYVLGVGARTERHVYLLLAELVERAARQLDERRAMTGRWGAGSAQDGPTRGPFRVWVLAVSYSQTEGNSW